jgi:polyisoprenoid-binding protein YceI
MTSSASTTRTFDGVTVPEPGTYTLDPAHTVVSFVARHLMVSKVRGGFSEVSGAITVGENPLESAVTATIGVASINTGAPDRDGHLRGADFLDVEKYPTITFNSLRLVSHKGTEFVLAGELTIRDVTREVELAVEFDGLATSPYGKEVIAFTASTEIDREDYGMTWNVALETGGVLVGKKVKIELSAEAVRAE